VPDAQAPLRALHDEVDRESAALAARHRERLHCARGCNACCVDGLTVFEVEAERIRSRHPELLREGTPHPPGACAFLGDAGQCRVYAERPYVCRTQGLPLRWIEEDERGELVERRDLCPLNAEGEPLEALPEADCWALGPCEERLRRIQEARDGGAGRRVALRALFRRGENEPALG
jgi:Fe-S-cluster containining protein